MSGRKKKRSIVLTIIFIIAIICFAYSAFQIGKYLYQTYLTNKTRGEVAAMVHDDTAETEESDSAADERAEMYAKYGDIYEENHDFIGWLKVDDTGIDNPVMFTPDDGVDGQYYLRKNFYKNYDIAGTLFVDFRNVLDPDKGISTNTIIYGHRMRNDTMFGPLKHYKDEDYRKAHSIIQFDTLYRPGTYKLFAVVMTQANTGSRDTEAKKYYNFINASSETEFSTWLDNIKADAIFYDEENAPAFGDELLTLSTCDYYANDGRLALIAKRIK